MNLFWLSTAAGNETLRNAIPGAMIGLPEHPDVQAPLRRDPARIGGAVDELLRWWTPVMTDLRTATTDAEVGGVPVAAGDKVVVSFGSATVTSRSSATQTDWTEARARLAFGHRPHFRLGAQLARVKIRALLTEVLTRTSTFTRPPNCQRGVNRVPVRWTA